MAIKEKCEERIIDCTQIFFNKKLKQGQHKAP